MHSFVLSLLSIGAASATSLQQISFEELVDRADSIVVGRVTRTWSDWDADHKFIWTNSEVAVESASKGSLNRTVTVSELGGEADGVSMTVAGSPRYVQGEHVVVFLKQNAGMAYRTLGWTQGHYQIDAHGRIHGELAHGNVQLTRAKTQSAESVVYSLEGITVQELHRRVANRVRHAGAR